MLELSLLFCLVALVITILNLFSIITPRTGGQILKKVSVLVPLRNEEVNAVAIVETLAAQENLSDVEFLILNDNSADKTFELITSAVGSDARFKIMQGSALPQGWLLSLIHI